MSRLSPRPPKRDPRLVGQDPATASKKRRADEAFESTTASPVKKLRDLGVDPTTPLGPAKIGKSNIVDTLSASRFAEFEAMQVPGKVAWVNFDLARQMGFDVPPGNRMTAEFHEQLMDALSYKIPGPADLANGGRKIKMYADRYGGSGIGGNGGAGRAGFLPWGNLNIKGVGNTPLSKPSGDFQHSHGGAPMKEGLLEAIWGEVNMNLFAEGSTQILAVIDHGDYTEWPGGGRERRALIVRAGSQLRPAHFCIGGQQSAAAALHFERATKMTGDLVKRLDGDKPVTDLAATMRNVIDKHARTAAEQFRWRILHGAVSTSNMELDGAQLDLATETSQRRTAPIQVLDFVDPDKEGFGNEHYQRGVELDRMWSSVTRSLDHHDRARFNGEGVEVKAELNAAYGRELELELLKACGLKGEMAEAIRDADPALAADFRDALVDMAKLRNGSGKVLVDKKNAKDVAVADVFGMLQTMPSRYFANPDADHTTAIAEALQPVITGSYQQKTSTTKAFETQLAELAPLYGAVMARATELADTCYDGVDAMKRSITTRAAFENQPMDRLYRANLNHTVVKAIGQYESSGDLSLFKEAIDKTVSASVRNVEQLLEQGSAKVLPSGGYELGARTIDGVDYSVLAWSGGSSRLHLELPVDGDRHKGYKLSTIAGAPHLRRDQIDHLSYRFTTDGWQTTQEVPARLDTNSDGARVITFDIPMLTAEAGRLEGLFHCATDGDFWLKDGSSNFRGYVFATPDERELGTLKSRLQ